MIRPSEDKPKKNEVSAWTVATGNVDIFRKKSRDAVKYIKDLKGFLGVHPTPNGTLWLFDSKETAMQGRNEMDKVGIHTGDNICECFVEKKYLKGETNE